MQKKDGALDSIRENAKGPDEHEIIKNEFSILHAESNPNYDGIRHESAYLSRLEHQSNGVDMSEAGSNPYHNESKQKLLNKNAFPNSMDMNSLMANKFKIK